MENLFLGILIFFIIVNGSISLEIKDILKDILGELKKRRKS